MRKMILLVGVLWFSLGNMVALADGMVLPLPEGVNSEYVAVRTHHVTVSIEDNHAVTRVDQEFTNPHRFPVAGRYLFPVPPEAILSRFQATVEGRGQRLDRQDRATANALLYATVARQRDPSLLQYADWESLAFDLSLEPGESRQVSLEYEQVLAPRGGLYRYRYVLSTERYSWEPLEEVSLSVDIRSTSGLASLYSSSHRVTAERLGRGRARLSWEDRGVRPTEDFELFYAPSEGGFGGGMLTGHRNNHDHFLFLFSPDLQSSPARILPKDIVFVVDRSGSMDGDKIEQAQDALHFVLGQLGEDDHFAIVSFNQEISILNPLLQPVGEQTLRRARRYVDRLTAEGNTDIEGALQAGLEILTRSEHRGATRMVLFLTDGMPTAGTTDEKATAHLVAQANRSLEARLHVFGVGYDVNTHLLDSLAADNGGTVTYVQPGEDLESALTGFYGKIASPLLTDVEVEFEGLETSDLYPQAIPDLFQGSSLLLTGRYQSDGGPITVRVRGRAGDDPREFVYQFDLDESGGRDFVPRLWATRRVGALLDEVRVEGESDALVDEIRDLGMGYGLVTPYTTFVIEGQVEGAASADNMDLYGRAEVNRSSGKTTIQARVQNQAYQQAAQADLATGANVTHNGQHSLAQVGAQNVDLSLFQGQRVSDGPITPEWIDRNVDIDRVVPFGSEAYFALAEDPEIRPFLQSGSNVVFAYEGEVISVRDAEIEDAQGEVHLPGAPHLWDQSSHPTNLVLQAVAALLGLVVWFVR